MPTRKAHRLQNPLAMNRYYPEINCAAHTLPFLQARRVELAQLGLSGGLNEKRSVHRKAELRAIDAGIRARGQQPVRPPRARVLPASAPSDVAQVQAHATLPAPPPASACGYSQALRAVGLHYAPVVHSVYY